MPGLCAPAPRPSVVPTLGEVLPGLVIEPVLAADPSNSLCLQTWDGRKATTAPSVEYQGTTYVAAPVAFGLMQGVRFPPASKSFGSAEKLISSMLEFLSRYALVPPDAGSLLVALALASWFPDCVFVAPVLYLLGPESAVRLVLRLLGCVCRRPVLLGDVDLASLATLPGQLCATLLISQRQLAHRVTRALLASNHRRFGLARGKGWLDLYGAKALACDSANEFGVRVSLPPVQDPVPILTDQQEHVVTQDFHAKLLRYRMVHHARVRSAAPDCSEFVPAMRDEVRTWLALFATARN